MANEGKRIFQYPEVTTLTDDDYALIDNRTGGPKSIKAKKLAPSLMSKTITERGVYKASDDGVRGYNEVNVNIPYTDIHVATGAVATFEGEDLPLKSLTASIESVQAGSGDPSPTNVRPISGWSAVDVTVADDVDNPTTTKTITIQLGDTYYGGTLDVVSGVLTVDRAYYNISDITFSESGNYYRIVDNSIPFAKSQNSEDGILSHFNYGGYGECIVGITPSSGHYIMFYKNRVDNLLSISSVADFNAYLVSQKTNGNPVQLVYKLATPLTIQLTPTEVKSLDGDNNVFASTGDVDVEYQTVWVRPTE